MHEVKKLEGHRLQVKLDVNTQEVHIEGNKAGLEYLVAVLHAVIGQEPGPNHWHLGEAFGTLAPGSPDLLITFTTKSG